ncbi:MAG: hypothetical protein HYW27_03740 [Candidatus Aenigmarchaeota archaeon]|nr:hypothetical protein [Candidatus Aenigmarchaeota archaeon]
MAYENNPYESMKKTKTEGYKAKVGYKEEEKEKYPQSPEKPHEYLARKDTERLVVSREAMPRIDDARIESLKRMAPVIVGDLFDRVRFLEERIAEMKDMMQTRETIHQMIIEDIDKDIIEKDRLAGIVSDLHERRNLKLDISILRKEKRHESVQFWKDHLELMTELRTLSEQYETESKIVGIFRNVSDNNAVQDAV